jgi:hypothetical protein
MTTKPPAVQVLTVTTAGIHAKIYGKDMSYNASTGAFFIAQNRKWVSATPNMLHQTILKDRHSQWLAAEQRKEFIKNNPLYRTSKQRFADACVSGWQN